jgi:hydroxyacylglutathione hydrolase
VVVVIERTPLEDELGDVLEKALSLTGLSVAALAAHSGVEEERLVDAMGYRGEFTGEELDRLASALDLRGPGLRAVAGGCYPLPEIAGLPFCLYPLRMPHGIGVANAYLVADCRADHGILFDTGTDPEGLRRVWPDKIRHLDAVCLTHVETEHAGGLPEVRRRWGEVPVFGPAGGKLPTGGVALGENAGLELGGFKITVWRTPGHAEAHNCYVIQRPGARQGVPLLVTGDLLFAGSVGGAYYCRRRLTESLARLAQDLPDATVVAPGHGPLTTLANERAHNPFLHPPA